MAQTMRLSFNGRTGEYESPDQGSSPCGRTKYADIAQRLVYESSKLEMSVRFRLSAQFNAGLV